jgi:DNA-binding NtrC family response regulator
MSVKILVVDDQEEYLRSLGRALKGEYEVLTASSMEQGKAVSFEGVQSAIVDIRLVADDTNNRDGLLFIKWLRENHPGVVPIAMSAMEDPALEGQATSAGAAMFLPKPVRVSDLKNLLRRLVG